MSFHGKGDLTTGPIGAHLLRLTVPMTWGIAAVISFQLVNTVYISLLGTEKLAAISFTFPITYIIFALFMGFSIGMSSVVSRLIGEKKSDDIRRVVTHGLVMVAIMGAVIALTGLLFMNPVFRAMGASDAMIEKIDDYMNLYYIGTAFICMPLVGNAALRASGDTLTPALIMLGAALANALIDPLLIFGLFGFPRLELQGAAISTVLANAGATVAGLLILRRKNMVGSSYLRDFSAFPDSARRLLFIALPAGITSTLPAILNSVIISLLSRSGDAAVAAFGVVTRIEAFVFIIMMALSVGMGPIIGQNWGAGRQDRVRETLRQALLFCVLWSLFVACILALCGGLIAQGFSGDEDVRKAMVLYFMIVPFTYPFANIVSGWGSAFNAMGKPQYSAGMIFLKMIVILIPAVHIGYALDGMGGVFGAIAIVNVVTGIAFHLLGRSVCNRASVTAREAT